MHRDVSFFNYSLAGTGGNVSQNKCHFVPQLAAKRSPVDLDADEDTHFVH